MRFLGGTDDYSLKNVLAAEAAALPTAEFVAAHADRFRELAGPLGLSFDDFIRTSSDPRHRPAVERLWRACAARGDLYRRAYEGHYCVGCEQFYDLADAADRRCPEHRTPLEEVAEENWFFRLSAYQDHLEDVISRGELVIHPDPFRDEVLSFVRRGLHDISVSRSVGRARGWGIGVPDDPTQVIYVWFDALTNYVSALGFGDPDSPDYREWWLQADQRVHVIGKGITRFHGVYWPAFLASAGQPLPTRIQVHPYLTVDGAELSKSSGATVDPFDVAATYGTDALRWWFARDVAAVADTNFTIERLVARANEDLANGIGNVAQRIATLVRRAHDRGVTVTVTDTEPISPVDRLEQVVGERLLDFDLRGATAAINDAVATLNKDLEATTPWRLLNRLDDDAATTVGPLLGRHLASARLIVRAAQPIVPTLAEVAEQTLAPDAPPQPPPFARLTS